MLATASLATIVGMSPSRGAEAARGPAAPAARPSAPARGGENSGAANEHHNDQRAGRTVYVPNYGYANWYGNYGNPYWNTQGPWYVDNGYPTSGQSTSGDANAPAPVPARQPQEEAALADITSARARLARQFESNEDVRSALHDVQDAQRAYDATIARVRHDLQQDPDYQLAEAKKERSAKKVEAAQAAADRQPVVSNPTTQPAPISSAVVRAAERKLNAASEVTAIAVDREQQDPAVKAAREKLEAANDRLNGLKEKFDASLQADPQYQAATQKLVAARAAAHS